MNKNVISILVLAGVIFIGGVLLFKGSSQPRTQEETTPMTDQTKQTDVQNSPEPQEPQASTKSYTQYPQMIIDEDKTYQITLKTTKGDITVEMFPKEAPKTVNNFVFLAKDGFYNETPFHRIIKGFMIQGGDPLGNGTGGPGYQFADEKVTRSYTRGIVAMANSGPNTNGSQFFIMHADSDLPPSYTIFGQVIDGLDVVDGIAETPVASSPYGEKSIPQEKILIKEVVVKEN